MTQCTHTEWGTQAGHDRMIGMHELAKGISFIVPFKEYGTTLHILGK